MVGVPLTGFAVGPFVVGTGELRVVDSGARVGRPADKFSG